MAAVEQDVRRDERRSVLSRVIPIVAAISLAGLLILLIGDLAGVEGADEGEDGSVIFDIAWVSFSLGAILCLVLGIVALVQGRRPERAEERRAGRIGVGWFLIAVVATAIAASVS